MVAWCVNIRTFWRAAWLGWLLTILLAGCTATVAPSAPSPQGDVAAGIQSRAAFVLVEQREPAFTVFAGIPSGLDKAKLEEIKAKVARDDKVSMLTWKQFTEKVKDYARAVIKRNDYPKFSVVHGLVCLVGTAPGAPWGLTWNGGIALTYNDYQYARRRYASYQADPGAYRPQRDPRADPVNPGGHLPAFGCLRR